MIDFKENSQNEFYPLMETNKTLDKLRTKNKGCYVYTLDFWPQDDNFYTLILKRIHRMKVMTAIRGNLNIGIKREKFPEMVARNSFKMEQKRIKEHL